MNILLTRTVNSLSPYVHIYIMFIINVQGKNLDKKRFLQLENLDIYLIKSISYNYNGFGVQIRGENYNVKSGATRGSSLEKIICNCQREGIFRGVKV